MSDKPKYTAEEKRTAIERELGYRRYVYPKRVAAGKMKQSDADYQIAVMDEIAADYAALAKKDRLI